MSVCVSFEAGVSSGNLQRNLQRATGSHGSGLGAINVSLELGLRCNAE